MLTLARQEPGAAEYAAEPVKLGALVRSVVVDHQPLAEAKQIDLGVTEADDAAVVFGDVDALRILLANLVGNALRYTPAGGRVDVACGQRTEGVFLEVTDTGPGIPASDRERVFDRFYRRENDGMASDGGNSGSGLGLSIVRTIAERHQATIRLSDAESGGLRARVLFAHPEKADA